MTTKESRKRSGEVRTREMRMQKKRKRKVIGMTTMNKVTRSTSRSKMLKLMIGRIVTSRSTRETSQKKWKKKGQFHLEINKMKGQMMRKDKDRIKVSKRWM